MTITLLRHGKPDHHLPDCRSALAMAQWCEAYDLAEICDHPPERSLRLIALSQHCDVLLVGHAIMNKLIARQLHQLGWLGEENASRRHWSSAFYHPPLI